MRGTRQRRACVRPGGLAAWWTARHSGRGACDAQALARGMFRQHLSRVACKQLTAIHGKPAKAACPCVGMRRPPASGMQVHVPARRCAWPQGQDAAASLLAVTDMKETDAGLPWGSLKGTAVTVTPAGFGLRRRVANCEARGGHTEQCDEIDEAGAA